MSEVTPTEHSTRDGTCEEDRVSVQQTSGLAMLQKKTATANTLLTSDGSDADEDEFLVEFTDEELTKAPREQWDEEEEVSMRNDDAVDGSDDDDHYDDPLEVTDILGMMDLDESPNGVGSNLLEQEEGSLSGRRRKSRKKEQEEGTTEVFEEEAEEEAEEEEGVSCEFEKALSKNIEGMKRDKAIVLAEVLRFLFHDSADANNLIVKDQSTRKWTKAQEKDGTQYGGLDGCMYSPLTKGMRGMYEPQHNKNVHHRLGFAGEACKRICRASRSGICKSLGSCLVDVAALGSVVKLNQKSHGNTDLTMLWGRKKGNCKQPFQNPWSEVEQKVVSFQKLPALRFAPSLHGLENPDTFRKAFRRLNFTAVEQAALMGGHSVGRITACAGGLNGIERGPWCNIGKRLTPPINSSNLESNGCLAKVGVKSDCWRKNSNGLTPIFARTKANEEKRKFSAGFSDGGFFDVTPRRFDNEYYKHMANEEFEGKDNCCGGLTANGCHRTGTMVKVTKRSPAGRAIAGKKIPGQACSVSFCRSDRDGRTHMKSTKIWHEPEGHKGLDGKGTHHGTTLRIIRLAGDWALLGHEDTKAAVMKFAEDELAWHRAFGAAWAKVISKGYDQGELRACVDRPMSKTEDKQRKALWR